MNQTNLTKSFLVLVAILWLPIIGATGVPTDPVEELKNCARTEDRNDRIACFELLGKRVLEQEVSDVPPPTEPEPEPEAEPEAVVAVLPAAAPIKPAAQATQTGLPDEIGGSEFEKPKEKIEDEISPATGHVNRCRKTRDDLWYFYFDSGQEWRQNGQGKYRFENCDFNATISKDFFGFKMQIEDGRKIRVRRMK